MVELVPANGQGVIKGCETIGSHLDRKGVRGKLNTKTVFLAEEVMLDLVRHTDGNEQLRIAMRRSRGTVTVDISARGEEYDRINGFEIGVDDYVVKPFSPKELMLRIDAIMKRAGGSAAQSDVIVAGGIRADVTARIVYVDGERVALTPKEYDLLFYMMKNKNIALSREKLITEVWGWDYYGDDRTLDTHVKLLRRSLGEWSRMIVTLRGVGYRFDENA